VTTYSYVVSPLPDMIINDLRLKEQGYQVQPIGLCYQAFPDPRQGALSAKSDTVSRTHAKLFITVVKPTHPRLVQPRLSAFVCSVLTH